MFVGIDLAERMSAAVIISNTGKVLWETCVDAGKQETPPNPWKNIDAVGDWWETICSHHNGASSHYVIETPHFHARNGEPALLVQGGLLRAMQVSGVNPAYVQRIPAMEWQKFFGYSRKEHGDTKVWAEEYARIYLDYRPGQTWPEGTRVVKKMREDLTDARLLAEWLRQTT